MKIRKMVYRFLFLLCVFIPNFAQSELFLPLRLAFPCQCECHFDNNIATKGTWLEAEPRNLIQEYHKYINLIPRPYLPDCSSCDDCGGATLMYNNNFDWATDEGWDRLLDGHKFYNENSFFPRLDSCRNDLPCDFLCWDGGYFRKWNHKYFKFFNHYLQYCSENTLCHCFWPETCILAKADNNLVYSLLEQLAEDGIIDYTFSDNWIGRDISWGLGINPQRCVRNYSTPYYPNSHGIASSLVTYTFFYSQYYCMLMDVAAFIDQQDQYILLNGTISLNEIYSVLERIRESFTLRYDICLQNHPHPKIYYERGMLRMHCGETEGALKDIQLLIEMANSDQFKDTFSFDSEMYHQEGQIYAELGQYDKAIAALSKAINQDPNNKNAYFHRAAAYFEMGQFDMALADFISSDRKPQDSGFFPKLEFEIALVTGLLRGTVEATCDFVPSMCHSTYGLGRTLWSCAKEPTRSCKNFVKCCWEIADDIKTYCQTIDWNTIEGYSQHIHDLYKKYDSLNDQEKGDLIGYTIARYGVDIFIGSASVKMVSSYKKLRNANTLCNLEVALAESTKESIALEAMAHARAREQYFANVRIHWGRQNKHIPGEHNFDLDRGRITISKTRLEALVKQNAGKGQRVNNVSPLSPDYRERVDFNEIIGEFALKVEGKPTEFFPTKKGILRYSKDGVHVTPANP